jgi:hypothetical protein
MVSLLLARMYFVVGEVRCEMLLLEDDELQVRLREYHFRFCQSLSLRGGFEFVLARHGRRIGSK